MKLVKKIVRSPFFRISSLNGLSVLLKIGIGFLTSKVLAVYVGPAGMALVGNLRNFLTSAEGIATLGFQNGIVKYVAESQKDETAFKKVLSTVFFTLAAVAVAGALLLFCFASTWSRAVFAGDETFAGVFRVMAAALPFYAASVVVISVLNGFGLFKKVIVANMLGNAIGLFISVFLIYSYQTFGALLSIVIAPAALFFITVFYAGSKLKLFVLSRGFFDAGILKKLASYSVMALVSAICVPLAYLGIRQKAMVVAGIDAAGHWEAMNRISSYSLLFATTLVSVYFLPQLVMAHDNKKLQVIFFSYFKGVLPVFALGSAFVYLMRDHVVRLLFTNDFLPVTQLFGWQLMGDIFKVASLILGYCFFAKRLTVAYVVSEIASLSILYFTSTFFLAIIGVEGLVLAHLVTYAAYFAMLLAYFRKAIFKRFNRDAP